MNWYYQIDGKRMGPVDTEKMRQLLLSETIKADTLVWNENIPKWTQYSQLSDIMREGLPAAGGSTPGVNPSAPPLGGDPRQGASTDSMLCAECKNVYPAAYLAKFGDRYICARCKNIYVQKMREGISPSGIFHYAGFWIRVGAYLIDGIIIGVVNFVLQIIFMSFLNIPDMSDTMAANPDLIRQFIFPYVILFLLEFIIGVGYPTFFVGKYGATPGKMICGLVVIRPDGSRVTYSRALGRYFAQILSGLILGIGYLMVAFDDECRALHDRICDTRVIRKER